MNVPKISISKHSFGVLFGVWSYAYICDILMLSKKIKNFSKKTTTFLKKNRNFFKNVLVFFIVTNAS